MHDDLPPGRVPLHGLELGEAQSRIGPNVAAMRLRCFSATFLHCKWFAHRAVISVCAIGTVIGTIGIAAVVPTAAVSHARDQLPQG